VIEVFIKSWFLYIFYGKGLTNYYIVADKVFVFGWDVLGELGDKILRFKELDVLFPVYIVLRLVNDCAV